MSVHIITGISQYSESSCRVFRNTYFMTGNAESNGNISDEGRAQITKETPFSQSEAVYIMNRYSKMDPSSGGRDGIIVEDCIKMPEFTGCVFAPDIISFFTDKDTERIHPRQFLQICAMLSQKTAAKRKKEFLFDMFDTDNQQVLTHDGMFRIYKLMFSYTVTEDHILALTFSALRHPFLKKEGEVSREEFIQMIPDYEIQEKMTVHLAPAVA